jgi:hypothetical protein
MNVLMDNMNTGTLHNITNGGAIGTGITTGIITGTATSAITASSFNARTPVEAIINRYELNEFVVQHRVQEHELLKLKETNVDYAEIIKENMTKSCAKDLIKKMSFTKKTDIDSDTHSFRGRVWVFTKEELTQMITEIRNGI